MISNWFARSATFGWSPPVASSENVILFPPLSWWCLIVGFPTL
jgi:hypothetical protein